MRNNYLSYLSIILGLTIFNLNSYAKVSSTNNIMFDAHKDGIAEMTLSQNGLGIGISTPGANLHVGGNTILGKVSIGKNHEKPSHDMDIHGSVGYGIYSTSSNASIGGNHIIFADTSSNSIDLSLPDASQSTGRELRIYKTSGNNSLHIIGPTHGTGNMKLAKNNAALEGLVLTLGHRQSGHCKMISYGGKWNLLEVSDQYILSNSKINHLVANWSLNEPKKSAITYTDQVGLSSYFYPSPFSLGSLNPGGTFSISIWVKWDGSNTGQHQQIISKRDSWGNTTMMWQFGRNNNGNLTFESSVGAANFGTDLSSNSWDHLVLTVENSTKANLYKNGILASANVNCAIGTGTTAQLVLGAAQVTGNENFYGSMSELMIFNTNLSSAEVTNLFARGM
jgi:hypothetical protein